MSVGYLVSENLSSNEQILGWHIDDDALTLSAAAAATTANALHYYVETDSNMQLAMPKVFLEVE